MTGAPSPRTVLVTGGLGFVGRHLCTHLSLAGYKVTALGRDAAAPPFSNPVRIEVVEDYLQMARLEPLLMSSDVVIHLAARAHIIRETDGDGTAAFERINVLGTEMLARLAARSGVRRLVFVSSIGVHGRLSDAAPLTESSALNPSDAYARSKLKAEEVLAVVARETGLETVIVRPPLIYGSGVKGNFYRLLRLADTAWPLPLGGCEGVRSFIGIENLCALLGILVNHPAAGGKVFVVADDECLSVAELVATLRRHMGRKPRLFKLPSGLLSAAAATVGMQTDYERLTLPLQVDSGLARSSLGWHPPRSQESGLLEMVRWFQALPE